MTPEPGREIVLFNATGAYAWNPRESEKARIEKLVACEFLWQIPDRDDVFHWQAGIVDLDADGLEDLVLPTAGGYRIALQRRGEGAAGAPAERSQGRRGLDPLRLAQHGGARCR